MNTLKSIGAVVAGFAAVFILSVGSDYILESSGFFPGTAHPELYTSSMLFLALIYRCIYTIAGGYLTAMLAPGNPVRHAVILGSIGTVAALGGAIAGWNLSAHWYPIALVVTGLPCTWLGGKLFVGRIR